jgi:uncharacterized glyoxalase superfamily protein PhnB
MEQQNEAGTAQQKPKREPTPNVIILCAAGHVYDGQNGRTQRYAVTDDAGNALYFGTVNKKFQAERRENWEKKNGAVRPENEWQWDESVASAELNAGKKALWLADKITDAAGVKNKSVTVYLVVSNQEEAARTERRLVAKALNDEFRINVMQVSPDMNPAVAIAQGRGYKEPKEISKEALASLVPKQVDARNVVSAVWDAHRDWKAAQAPAQDLAQEQAADQLLSQGQGAPEPQPEDEEEQGQQAGAAIA